MELTYKDIPGVGGVMFNPSTGDYMKEVTSEIMNEYFGGITGRPDVWYYRLYRENDRQLFGLRVEGVWPSDKDDQLERILNPIRTREEEFKYGVDIKMESTWGKYFPPEEIDDFIPYIFEFFYFRYKSIGPFVEFEYIYPVTGKKFELMRCNEGAGASAPKAKAKKRTVN